MIGPIVHRELIHARQRGYQPIYCWAYAFWLIFLFGSLYFNYWSHVREWDRTEDHLNPTGPFVGFFLTSFLIQQFALLVVLVPVFSADTISEEKRHDTLAALLITNLTAAA